MLFALAGMLALGFVGLMGLMGLVGEMPLGDHKVALRMTNDKRAKLLYEGGDATKPRGLSKEEGEAADALEAEAKEHETRIKALEAKAETDAARSASLQASVAFMGEAKPHKPADTEAPKAAVTHTHDNAADAPYHGKTPRAFLLDVMRAATGNVAEALKPLRVAAAAGSDEQSGFADGFGAFTIPTTVLGRMLQIAPESDPMGSRVTRIPMASKSVEINARTDKDHSDSVTGGFRTYRRAEADTVASSRAQTELLKLEAHSLMGVAYATEEILTDSPMSFAAIIEAGFSDEMVNTLVNERLNGTGVGEFEGVAISPALISIAKEDGQPASTIVPENILNMRARAWQYQNGIWMANATLIPQLATLKLDDGSSVLPWFQPSLQTDLPSVLLGRPIVFSEYIPALGSAGQLGIYNWSQFLEGDYQGLQSETSIHVRFLQNTRTFRVTLRNDGRSWWRSALTPKNGDTLSPWVRLAA